MSGRAKRSPLPAVTPPATDPCERCASATACSMLTIDAETHHVCDECRTSVLNVVSAALKERAATGPVSPALRPATGDVLDTLLDMIAERVAGRCSPSPTESRTAGSPFYDARSVPKEIGARAFLEAARRGDFPSAVIAKRRVARREDVHAWIESRLSKAAPPAAKLSDEELLRQSGLALPARRAP